MTPKQKAILSKYRRRLKTAFADALTTMTEPGHQRDWFVSYLSDVLATCNELRAKTVNGKRLSSLLSKSPSGVIRRLIRNTCNRDRKTRSRWAAALVAAYNAGVSPEKLGPWLRQGGGVSGRAR
jgi:hypothetical protein